MALHSATVFMGLHTDGVKRDKIDNLTTLLYDMINSVPSKLHFVINSFNEKCEVVARGQLSSGLDFTPFDMEVEIMKNIKKSNKAFVYDAWRKLLMDASTPNNSYLAGTSVNHIVIFTDEEDSGSIHADLPTLLEETAARLNPFLHLTFIKSGDDQTIGSMLREKCSPEFCHAISVEDSLQGWEKGFDLLRDRIMIQLDAAERQIQAATPVLPALQESGSGVVELAAKLNEMEISGIQKKTVTFSKPTEPPSASASAGLFQPLRENGSTFEAMTASSDVNLVKLIPGRRVVVNPIRPEVLSRLKPTFENTWDKSMANGRCRTLCMESTLFSFAEDEPAGGDAGRTSHRKISKVNGNTYYAQGGSKSAPKHEARPSPSAASYKGRGAFHANEAQAFDSNAHSWRAVPRTIEPQIFGIRVERIPVNMTDETILSIFQQWGSCTLAKSGMTSPTFRWVELNFCTLKESRAAIKYGARIKLSGGAKLIIFIV